MFVNQTIMDHSLDRHHSPWSIQQKMIDFVVSFNLDHGSNLHYLKTATLNENLVNCQAIDDYHILFDKMNDCVWF